MSYYPTGYYPTGYYPEGYYGSVEGGGSVVADLPVSLDSVVNFVTNPATTNTDRTAIEEYIADLIAEVFAEFEAETRMPITRSASYRYTFTGNGKYFHVVQLPCVNSVSTLEYFNRATHEWTEVDSTNYYIDDSDGHTEFGGYLFAADVPHRATVDAGYTFGAAGGGLPTLPADIQDAVRSMVVLRYYDASRSGRDRFGLQNEASSGPTSVTLVYDRATTLAKWSKVVRKYSR